MSIKNNNTDKTSEMLDKIEHLLVEEAIVWDDIKNVKKELCKIETLFNCKIKCYKEDINTLQREWTFVVDINNENWVFKIEEGINNGTVVLDVYEDNEFTYDYERTMSVLDDVIIDTSQAENTLQLNKMEAILKSRKNEIIENYRKECYDSFVTGSSSKLNHDTPILSELPLDYVFKVTDCDKRVTEI